VLHIDLLGSLAGEGRDKLELVAKDLLGFLWIVLAIDALEMGILQ
jgi:hypothetical protein